MKNSFVKSVNNSLDSEAYKIGTFQGKYFYDYRPQFYYLFGWGKKDSIKNPKALMKEWFNQVSLDGKHVRLCVNKAHTIQLSESPILRQLLKEKYIKIVRNGLPSTKHSYLVKNL